MNNIIGIFIGGLAICLFYVYAYFCLKISGIKGIIKNISKKEIIYILIFFVVSSMFMANMLGKNKFIYFWDCTMHWTPTISLSKDLFIDPIGTLKTIYNTTGITDYNWVMPLLYALPAKFFGASFNSVILFVYVLYMCPAYFIISLCINKYLYLFGYKKSRVLIYMLLTFLMPLVEYVLLKGYLDPPVLIISTLILLMSSDFQYDHFDWKWSTLMALGIFSLVLFRRHWGYWVVGLIFSLGVSFLSQLSKYTWKKTVKFFLENMMYIASFCILLLAFLFRPFLQRSLRNYSEIYAGWNTSIGKKIIEINEAYGNFILIILIFSIFYLWINRRGLKYLIGIWVQMVIPIFIMMKVVLMHDSHFYFAVVPILILLALLIETAINCIKRKPFQYFFVGFTVIYLLYNFLCCFWKSTFAFYDKNICRYAFCNLYYQPYYRDDVESVKDLVSYLNELTTELDTTCYICASSQNINFHMLNLADAPNNLDALQNDLSVASSDLRDGFSTNFFDAGVVVIEKPIGDDTTYLEFQGKGSEGLRGYLTEQICDRTSPIGKHYKLTKQYQLDYKYLSSVEVYIKASDYERKDFEYLINHYNQIYPNYPELFANRISEYMKQHSE